MLLATRDAGIASVAGDLAGRHRNADPTPADAQAEARVTGRDRASHRGPEVGIVDPVGGVGTEVDDVVAGPGNMVGDQVLEVEAGMVGTESDAHGVILPAGSRRSRSDQYAAPR